LRLRQPAFLTLFDRVLWLVEFDGTTTNGGDLGMTFRPLRRAGRIGSGVCGEDVVPWAEGSAQFERNRAVPDSLRG